MGVDVVRLRGRSDTDIYSISFTAGAPKGFDQQIKGDISEFLQTLFDN